MYSTRFFTVAALLLVATACLAAAATTEAPLPPPAANWWWTRVFGGGGGGESELHAQRPGRTTSSPSRAEPPLVEPPPPPPPPDGATLLPENLVLGVLTVVGGALSVLLLSRMADYVVRLLWHLAIFIPTYALCRFVEAFFWKFWRHFVQPLALLSRLAGLLVAVDRV